MTGLGAVSPIGNTLDETWKALLTGKSGAGPITLFDASKHVVNFACEVKNFDPTLYINPKEQKKMDRFMRLGIAAAMQAWVRCGI